MRLARKLPGVGCRLVLAGLACLGLAGRALAQAAPRFVAVHGVGDADYQAWVAQTVRDGCRVAGVWTKSAPALAKWPLPASGREVSALAAFDRAMQQFMRERSITGGTLAVGKGDKLLLARAYGYADP